ncbi:Hypothetical predicted protein [Cloeon dipterum]|uniref:LEM domain-containing protein n=1 Tax=Cloeon dipterum TaxID=197152 RepID=A0A8S1DLZ7_9INSE|nr:Hypothetical predicted protein [Cloeon dipterum]
MPHVERMNDEELQNELTERGFQCGPITATTRAVYQRKLLELRKQLPEKEKRQNKNDRQILSQKCDRESDRLGSLAARECDRLRAELEIALNGRRIAEEEVRRQMARTDDLRLHLVSRIDDIISANRKRTFDPDSP